VRGCESERFTLYLFGIPIRLRDGGGTEPSVLMYQSDLCAALLDELEARHQGSDKLSIVFNTKVTSCDVNRMVITTSTQSAPQGPYDFIVGCDGVNSVVRDSIAAAMPTFDCTKTPIPGDYKVCRLDQSPPKVDPTSVCLILPKSGSTTAFVEPTADGSCILFAGRNKTDPVLYPTSVADAAAALESAFPLLEGVDFRDVAEQLMQQTTTSTSSIRCNTYHHGSNVVLVGDAAHATGGVSGQGVNSALVDAMVLADCGLNVAQYSKRQVPEGLALHDLSFGPNPTGLLGLKYKFQSAVESLFRGQFGTPMPLQTLLTTTLEPFAEIRRKRNSFYETEFPSQEEFDMQIDRLDSQSVD
jgi:kynurenine 3-monooxygenase